MNLIEQNLIQRGREFFSLIREPYKGPYLELINTEEKIRFLRKRLHFYEEPYKTRMKTVFTKYSPEFKNGDWLNLSPPSNKSQQTILMMEPPTHMYFYKDELEKMYNPCSLFI